MYKICDDALETRDCVEQLKAESPISSASNQFNYHFFVLNYIFFFRSGGRSEDRGKSLPMDGTGITD